MAPEGIVVEADSRPGLPDMDPRLHPAVGGNHSGEVARKGRPPVGMAAASRRDVATGGLRTGRREIRAFEPAAQTPPDAAHSRRREIDSIPDSPL